MTSRDVLPITACWALALLGATGCSRQSTDRPSAGETMESVDLGQYRWRNRPVFVFTPSEEDPGYSAQLRQFEGHDAGLQERDIVLFRLVAEGDRMVDGNDLSRPASDPLWERFEVPPEQFAIILVGKDGGVKLRSDEPVALQRIFDLIDSMPMRREEMRRRQ